MDRKSKSELFWKWLQVLDSCERDRGDSNPDPLLGQQRVKVKTNSSYSFRLNEMARPGRLELPTLCLEGRRSIQLSYGRSLPNFSYYNHLRYSLPCLFDGHFRYIRYN